MRSKDYNELQAATAHFYRGGLPDLGKPHEKSGYRWSVGFVATANGQERWRENLGRDKILAQYRAREMSDLWSSHVDHVLQRAVDPATGKHPPIESIEIPPLNREQAKREAWAEAEKALSTPAIIASAANETLQRGDNGGRIGPALSPGYKLVAVPFEVPDAKAATHAERQAEPKLPEKLTLHTLAERYGKHLAARFAQDDISDTTLAAWTTRFSKRIKELPEYALDTLGKEQLQEIRMTMQAKRRSDGAARSKCTVSSELGALKTMLIWAETEAEVWPSAPKRWERCLRAVFRNDHTEADPTAKAHDTYSIGELAKLYAAGGNSMKLWLLVVLNFAWGQKEIATCRKSHWKTVEKPELRRVARFRNKRAPGARPVPGRWQAFEETWALATARIEKTTNDPAENPKSLAFLSAQNQPLVRFAEKCRRLDAIAEAFEDTCAKAGVRHRGFYLLRHTGINLVKKIGGSEMADLYSQHAPQTTSQKHYENADWKRLRKVLRKLRVTLQPLFDKAAQRTATRLANRKSRKAVAVAGEQHH